MELPKINISDSHRKHLYDEFPVSRQTINDALKFHNNSDTAKKIRARAIELLQNEVKKAKKYIS